MGDLGYHGKERTLLGAWKELYVTSYKDTIVYSNEDFQPWEVEAYKHKQIIFVFICM